jgi:SAM-dependent methyltransferase
MSNSWDEVAEFWNDMEGREGDVYRRAIIIPAIGEAIAPFDEKRILDAGCGNGCIARVLVSQRATVTAIDSSKRQIEIARTYEDNGISYHCADLDDPNTSIVGGPFDSAIACFTLQDCHSIATPLRLLAKNLSKGGRLVIIYENDASFQSVSGHASTSRRWIDSEKHSGTGRRQLIFWEPRSISFLQRGQQAEELAADWSHGFKTITRYWSKNNYISACREVGLSLLHNFVSDELSPVAGADIPESLAFKRYCEKPRFGRLVFERVD